MNTRAVKDKLRALLEPTINGGETKMDLGLLKGF